MWVGIVRRVARDGDRARCCCSTRAMPGGLIDGDGDVRYGRTLAFHVLVLYQLVDAVCVRSDEVSAFARPFANRWLWGSIGAGAAAAGAVLYVPAAAARLRHGRRSPARDWVLCLAWRLTVLAVREVAQGRLPWRATAARVDARARTGESRRHSTGGTGAMRRIGVGIVGLGNAVKPHAAALKDLAERAEVIGGFSPSPQRRAQFTATWGWPGVESLDALLARSAGGGRAGPDAAAHARGGCARRGPRRQARAAGEAARRGLPQRQGAGRRCRGHGPDVRRGVPAPLPRGLDRAARAAARRRARVPAVGLGVGAVVALVRVLRRARPRQHGPRRRRRAAHAGDPHPRPDARPRGTGARA